MVKINQENKLKEKVIDNKLTSKLTAMIISGILGALGIIGLFWGREGYIVLGVLLAVSLIVLILAFGSSQDSY